MDMKWKNFKINRELELRNDDKVKHILADIFFTKDFQLDVNKATDFVMYNHGPISVGVRLRRYDYYLLPGYRDQFTVRFKLPSGTKTEFDKYIEGYCKYFFYGFLDKDENIIQYFLGNLNIFRDMIADKKDIEEYFNIYSLYKLDAEIRMQELRIKNKGKVFPKRLVWNWDKSSMFAIFEIQQFCRKDFLKTRCGFSDWLNKWLEWHNI